MQLLPFKATLREVGGSYVVTVPKTYIDNFPIKEGNEYQLTIEVSNK